MPEWFMDEPDALARLPHYRFRNGKAEGSTTSRARREVFERFIFPAVPYDRGGYGLLLIVPPSAEMAMAPNGAHRVGIIERLGLDPEVYGHWGVTVEMVEEACGGVVPERA